ncbi:12692_t:CDS:1, partial [Ambispora leptoticha]
RFLVYFTTILFLSMAAAIPIPKLKRNEAEGNAKDSPGIVSGNIIQAFVDVSINLCGNTITVIDVSNPAHGNLCVSE